MKIQDLLEDLVNATIDRKKYNGTLKTKNDSLIRSNKELGNGSQASVKHDPNDPHMVKKHNTKVYPSKPAWEFGQTNDGYNKYIEFLINNNLTDNIHFPKVYNVKTIVDKDENKIHTYTMEKLVESEHLSEEEVNAFIEHNLIGRWKIKLLDEYNALEDTCSLISNCICGYSEALTFFSNEELIEAIKTLTKVKAAIAGQIDLSSYNIMWRRTPHGMILVFTDPFY